MPIAEYKTFFEALTAAVSDIYEYGYDDPERLAYWSKTLRALTARYFGPVEKREDIIRRSLKAIYDRQVGKKAILKQHPDLLRVTSSPSGTLKLAGATPGRFTLERVEPSLRAELNRRIVASANLIKINRETRINEVLQRFEGWASSVPAGGSDATDKREVKKTIGNSLQSMDFLERRVAIDQGHKLIANISAILAEQSGAIAATWRQHFTQEPRIHHTKRDGKTYAIADGWAYQEGYINKGAGLTSESESYPVGRKTLLDPFQPGFLPYCRCSFTYWTSLRSVARLAPEMLTEKGRKYLEA